jgi:hypothetical protein
MVPTDVAERFNRAVVSSPAGHMRRGDGDGCTLSIAFKPSSHFCVAYRCRTRLLPVEAARLIPTRIPTPTRAAWSRSLRELAT